MKSLPTSMGELVLTARVARMFYLEQLTKTEIADTLNISRFRVARLLDTARITGMVRIEIGVPGVLDAALSAQLCSTFGLTHALVLDIADDNTPALRRRLGEAMGNLLADIATPQDVLGLGWARSLMAVTAAGSRLPPCPVVQLTGALARPDGNDLLDLIRGVCRSSRGPAHTYFAPMIIDTDRAANLIRRQPDLAAAVTLLPTVTIAVVGVGAWAAGQSALHDALPPSDQASFAAAGAAADVSGTVLNRSGAPITTTVTPRLIVATTDALIQIPTVLAAAYGHAKAPAVLAAITGGLINGVVTTTTLARALLSLASPPDGQHRQ